MLISRSKPTFGLKFSAPFNGTGIGAIGVLDAIPELADVRGKWRYLGELDVDARANANAGRYCGVQFTTLDLMPRERYRDHHGHEPPAGWREATPLDVRAAARFETPDVVVTSPPCRVYCGLLSEALSKSDQYQAMNELAPRGVWLCLEAYKEDLPSFFLLENVPRIATRGRRFLDQITGLLLAYGYAEAETTHDCGEIGGLSQSRKRFLFVARSIQKVPNYLYQPPRRPLRTVGATLGKLPEPTLHGEGMQRLPKLQWKTWMRLAFVQDGSDWRSLNRLRIAEGQLADYGLMPENRWYADAYGVQHLQQPSGDDYRQRPSRRRRLCCRRPPIRLARQRLLPVRRASLDRPDRRGHRHQVSGTGGVLHRRPAPAGNPYWKEGAADPAAASSPDCAGALRAACYMRIIRFAP